MLYGAYTDSSLKLWKKMFIALVIGYLFSPIDLIPDFIPLLGYLDDLVLVPIGIYISFKLIPPEIIDSARNKVKSGEINKVPIGYKTSLIIIILWGFGLVSVLYWLIKLVSI